jgi:hypothetical protein
MVLWGTGGEIPPVYPAQYPAVKLNQCDIAFISVKLQNGDYIYVIY